MERKIGPAEGADRITTPLHASGAYPILQTAAEEAARRLEDMDDEQARAIRDKLLRIAREMQSWSPTHRPSEEERARLLGELRVALDHAGGVRGA